MQRNNNEAAILPIDSFLEESFPFTDITLHLSTDAITFLMGGMSRMVGHAELAPRPN